VPIPLADATRRAQPRPTMFLLPQTKGYADPLQNRKVASAWFGTSWGIWTVPVPVAFV